MAALLFGIEDSVVDQPRRTYIGGNCYQRRTLDLLDAI
jgi:hypothetical protein